MPTYTYRCQKCGDEFERFQSMSDEPVKRCPACKGKVQRVFHPVGIVLKGSGFHRNDYRTASNKPASEKSEPSENKAEPSEKKAEKKADASDGSSSTTSGSKGKDKPDG